MRATGPARLGKQAETKETGNLCASVLAPVIYLSGRRERKQSKSVCFLIQILFVRVDKGKVFVM